MLLLLAPACKKENHGAVSPAAPGPAQPQQSSKYNGGKGGGYRRTFIPIYGNVPVPARIYLKYAAVGPPADTTKWDEVKHTTVGGGFGQYVRFDSLSPGTYYVLVKADKAEGDAIMEVNVFTPLNLNIFLKLND